MGSFAEESARDYQFTREAQDDYAIASLTRAQTAQSERLVRPRDRRRRDRRPQGPDDGRRGRAARQGRRLEDPDASSPPSPRTARSPPPTPRSHLATAPPRWSSPARASPTGSASSPSPASSATPPTPTSRPSSPPPRSARCSKALDKAGWTAADVDLYEVNEAFACVAMIAMRDLGIPHDKINVHGGATALGHPIGASGRAGPGDPAQRAGNPRRQEGRREPLHRRRRGDGDGGGAGGLKILPGTGRGTMRSMVEGSTKRYSLISTGEKE